MLPRKVANPNDTSDIVNSEHGSSGSENEYGFININNLISLQMIVMILYNNPVKWTNG